MALRMTPEQQSTLFKQGMLKKYQTNEYIRDKNNPNFVYIKDKFFANEKIEKIATLVVGSGMFLTVGSVFASRVGNPTVKVEQDSKLDGDMPVNKWVKDYCSIGFACIGLAVDEDGVFSLVHVPAESFIILDGNYTTITVYENDNNRDDNSVYILVKTFFDNGTIENQLYKKNGYYLADKSSVNTNFTLDNAEKVGLETIEQTKELEEIENIGMEINPLQLVIYDKEYFDQGKEVSYFIEIQDTVFSMDRKETMFDTQYLQYVDAYVLMKNIKLPEKLMKKYSDGIKLDYASFGKTFVSSDDKASIEFINNTNALLKEAKEQKPDDIGKISAITSIPMEFLGMETNEGAIGEGSRLLKMSVFISKIEHIRKEIDKIIQPIIQEIDEDAQYIRPDIFPKSAMDKLEEVSKAKSEGLMSHKLAIMKYQNISPEEADAQLIEITGETPEPVVIDNEEDLPPNDNENEED